MHRLCGKCGICAAGSAGIALRKELPGIFSVWQFFFSLKKGRTGFFVEIIPMKKMMYISLLYRKGKDELPW